MQVGSYTPFFNKQNLRSKSEAIQFTSVHRPNEEKPSSPPPKVLAFHPGKIDIKPISRSSATPPKPLEAFAHLASNLADDLETPGRTIDWQKLTALDSKRVRKVQSRIEKLQPSVATALPSAPDVSIFFRNPSTPDSPPFTRETLRIQLQTKVALREEAITLYRELGLNGHAKRLLQKLNEDYALLNMKRLQKGALKQLIQLYETTPWGGSVEEQQDQLGELYKQYCLILMNPLRKYNVQEAEHYLQKALKLYHSKLTKAKPNSLAVHELINDTIPILYLQLGEVYERTHRPNEAKALYEEALHFLNRFAIDELDTWKDDFTMLIESLA